MNRRATDSSKIVLQNRLPYSNPYNIVTCPLALYGDISCHFFPLQIS